MTRQKLKPKLSIRAVQHPTDKVSKKKSNDLQMANLSIIKH